MKFIEYDNLFSPAKKIIENNKKKDEEYKGIYFYMTNRQDIESLNAYVFLTKNLPINCCYLYCTKYTNSEELRSFLIRCFFCQINSLFCMVNTNLLNAKIRIKFFELIKKYSKIYGKKMKSCLIKWQKRGN